MWPCDIIAKTGASLLTKASAMDVLMIKYLFPCLQSVLGRSSGVIDNSACAVTRWHSPRDSTTATPIETLKQEPSGYLLQQASMHMWSLVFHNNHSTERLTSRLEEEKQNVSQTRTDRLIGRRLHRILIWCLLKWYPVDFPLVSCANIDDVISGIEGILCETI